jgi:hypothetical protein
VTGKVFISYASADQQTADKLVAEIERRGIPCWISSRDVLPGENYQGAIVEALEASAVFLLLFSRHANASVEIPRELGLASKFKKTVIPARLEDIVPSGPFAYQMTTAQFIDLFRDFESKVDGLCVRLAELLQSSAQVRERIAREQRRRAGIRKLERYAAGTLIILVLVATAWALRTRLERWLAGGTNRAPATAQVPAPQSPPAPVAQNNAAQPAAPAAIPNPAPVAAAPPAPALSAPIAPPHPAGTLASSTYDGIRFDAMNVSTERNSLKVLVTATETQKRDAKLQFFSTVAPQAIDDHGDISAGYQVTGMPNCGGPLTFCSKRDAQYWSQAYPDSPLTIVVQFYGPSAFSGSLVNVAFNVLLGVQSADGATQQTVAIPVVFTDLPLKPGAAAPPVLASHIFEGIRFDVLSVTAQRNRLFVAITGTDTEERDGRLQFLSSVIPQAIDDRGDTSLGSQVMGIPFCEGSLSFCSARDAQYWSKAYQDRPLLIVLQVYGSAPFTGSSINLSFDVILAIDPAGGGSPATKLVQVSFPGLPLN